MKEIMNNHELALVIGDLLDEAQERNLPEYLEELKLKIGFHLVKNSKAINDDDLVLNQIEMNVANALMRYVEKQILTRFQTQSLSEIRENSPHTN